VGTGDVNLSLLAHASWTVRQDNGRSFAPGQAGSALISSTQPIAAFVNVFSTGNVDASSYTAIPAVPRPGSTLYAPAITSGAYGGYTTGIGLLNVGDAPTDVTITYRDGAGGVARVQTLAAVPAHAYRGIFSGDSGSSTDARLPAGFAGSATLQSSGQPLAAVVHELGPGDQFSSYDAVAAGDTTLHVPTALNGAYGGYYTGIAVQNTTATAGVVTVSYYDRDGAPTAKSFPVAAGGQLGLYQGSVTQGPPTSVDGYTAVITSTVLVAAIVNEVAPATSPGARQSTAYNTVSAGSSTVHLASVESAGLDGLSTGLAIMNTSNTGAAVTVTYHDAATGEPVGTPQTIANLGPKAFWGVYQPTGGLPTGKHATAVVTVRGGQIAVVCNQRSPAQFMSYNGQ
jgi:hypothetical protein